MKYFHASIKGQRGATPQIEIDARCETIADLEELATIAEALTGVLIAAETPAAPQEDGAPTNGNN
jgi:hypothetical protein